MYSVTPLASGYTIELHEREEYGYRYIYVYNPAGEVEDSRYFGMGERIHARKVYDLMVALAGGPVAETVGLVPAA